MMIYFNWMSRNILCKKETFKLRLKKEKNHENSQVVYSSRKNNSSKDPMGGEKNPTTNNAPREIKDGQCG